MNQTLQHTKLAGAFSAMALLCALLLAEPVPQHRGVEPGALMLAAGGHAVGELGRGLARDIDLHARRLESELAATGPAGGALAMASSAMTGQVVDSTLAVLLDGFGSQRPTGATPAEATAPASRPARTRSAMAMPYFATAGVNHHGLGE
ncbi:hypothetical protein BGP89_12925 [Luteimonas sp. JM171]|uniref:hypothetical protein n=1 Tax=Luteimonas sp. JM171 TaxID=1896164 RepID=UPI0008589E26|nr:hypothetical protein [Luteimonas sp. JM171]AOH37140.1 hypothetical protein BGP89_12925 [Luteimonas sp. JM171]